MISFKPKAKKIVFIPSYMLDNHYVGPVFGRHISTTDVYNIISDKEEISDGVRLDYLGKITNAMPETNETFYGLWENDTLLFFSNEITYQFQAYEITQDVFSRNTGILETHHMMNMCAIIIGCGSVGSLVALELARAGVGRFVLIDTDIIEYHNICRHQCSFFDVGEYKVDAVAKRICAINPIAYIERYSQTIELIPKEVFDRNCNSGCIIIGCADNRAADVYANRLSVIYKIPFLSIGFWERAFAGEIFYYLPNRGMPCYQCALGDGSELSQRESVNRRLYTTQETLENIRFEPGISSDISFVTIIGIKLILDILNIDNQNYIQKLLPHLQQYTLVCNTNSTQIGGPMAEIFSYPLQVTTSLRVGFSSTCPPCKFE